MNIFKPFPGFYRLIFIKHIFTTMRITVIKFNKLIIISIDETVIEIKIKCKHLNIKFLII